MGFNPKDQPQKYKHCVYQLGNRLIQDLHDPESNFSSKNCNLKGSICILNELHYEYPYAITTQLILTRVSIA